MVNAEGVMRVLRDVSLRRTGRGEFIVLSMEAGVNGEVVTIHVPSEGNAPVPVRVIGSRPVIVDGLVQHELRLASLEGEPRIDAAFHGDLGAE